jgi:hypothetical protein
MPTPNPTSVTSDSGTNAGGISVLVEGTGFETGATITFGGSSAVNIIFINSTLIACVTPPHAIGAVNVVVTNPDTTTGTLTNGYTYVLPSVEAIDFAYTIATTPIPPVAIVAPASQDTVVGAVVRVDGRSSFSPVGSDLVYTWTFAQVPIGSQVAVTGFKSLEDDDSVVSFAPDIIGLYVVQLVVSDGSFDSEPAQSDVNTKVVLVPQNLGIVPDTSWVWNMLSDFWVRVEQRQRFETIWSSAVQIIAAEQLKLWQYDYNKSIQDIQELIQKRWIKYEPALTLDPTLTTFILADDQAGLNASTYLIDPSSNGPQANQPLFSNLVTVPSSEGNFAKTSYGSSIALGRLLELDEQSFTLSRTGIATRSVSRASDGSVSPGHNIFHGSAFSTGMAGMSLRILNGPAAGTYTILTITTSTQMTVKNADGTATVFPTSGAGLSYSIFPSSPNYNSFFADQNFVPTQQAPLPWRFSSTLVSTQYDFEAQGVSPGDVIVLQVARTDTSRASNVNVQVVSVDRGRIGFVFNTLDLTDGIASLTLSQNDQVQLANDLQVTGLAISNQTGGLLYSDQALAVKSVVQSAAFKRQFFELSLDPTDPINVGPFSITVTPLQVIRNSKILVDSTTKSVPSLQEYVKQPDVVQQNGGLFQISEGTLYPLARMPYVVYENTDYVLDAEDGISGTCAVTSGSAIVLVPFGDLLDRDIRQGDTLNLTEDTVVTSYQVLEIVDAQSLRIAPIPTFTDGAAPFTISRAVEGTFIRFVEGTFTKTMPAPARFWAEVTFFDNGDAVENNFGVLVGVLRSDLSSVGATISYKNAVAGLMYALTNGPTIANLQLASQILLGLPFTTSAGTVIEIDPDFKTNLDGSPLQGRILIAAEDSQGNPIGITNIYFYPQGRQIADPSNPGQWIPADPDLSGLAINPATNLPYAVGDSVDRFTALSKGTQVEDYLTTADLVQDALNQGNTAFAIQRYHSFQLIVNADITTAIDTDLVAQFIKKAKPTYVKLALALSKSFDDEVDITDALLFGRPVFMTDNESLSMPVSVSVDEQSIDSAFISVEGVMYSLRISGEDLVTAQSGYAVSSAAAGFINARPFESHDGSFIRPGYLVVITGGPNDGSYLVSAVNSDSQLTLSSSDSDGNPFVFQTETAQTFAVYMPITCEIVRGSCAVVNSSSTVSPTFGIGSTGVAVGDVFGFFNTSSMLSRPYHVTGVDPNTGTISITPPIQETSGTYTAVIYREGLITRHFGHRPGDLPLTFSIASSIATLQLGTSADPAIAVVAAPGDILVDATGDEYLILDVDPTTRIFYITPPLSGSTLSVDLVRLSRNGDTVISLDILDRMPGDSLFLSLERRATGSGGSGPDLTTTATSPTVGTVSGLNFATGLGVVPGDLLIVLAGADSTRDIGYGAGIFPIASVSGTTMTLTRPLTAANGSPGVLYGIQRRSPK